MREREPVALTVFAVVYITLPPLFWGYVVWFLLDAIEEEVQKREWLDGDFIPDPWLEEYAEKILTILGFI